MLDHCVLLRAMRRDERLFQPIAADKARITASCKDKAIVGSKQEWAGKLPGRARTGDERLVQHSARGAGLAAPRKTPIRQCRAGRPILRVRVSQTFYPPRTPRSSVARRSSGRVATEANVSIRSRKATGRLRSCQPLS